MNKPEIILVGGGGHCKSCIDVIETENKYCIKGIIDLPMEYGKSTLGYKVIGNDDDLPRLAKKGYNFLITLGHMGNVKRRVELFKIIKTNGGILPVIISPNSHVSDYSIIGEGTILMHYSIVNADTEVGNNCILNSKTLIEHDTVIGDNSHISTNAVINGNCIIGNDCFVGSSSTLKNGIEIVAGTFIGMGSIVTKPIKAKGLYFGNPAKKTKGL